MRQPARTLAALAGVALAVALIASIAAFVDGSARLMTTRALAPVTIGLQAVVNRPLATDAPTLDSLRTRIAATPGVGAAAAFASADLNAAALSAAGASLNGAAKLFAFDAGYLRDFPLVRVTTGAFAPGTALLSTEAATALNAKVGDRLRLALPGAAPLSVTLGGIADFRSAGPLFASRSVDTQGEFTYVPNSIVLDLETFSSAVLPALRADAASASPGLRTPPVLEVQVRTDRARYANLDPAAALASAQGLRRTIERIVPGEVRVIDNIASALAGAQGDSVLAKIMFLFLGTPGVLLAAYIARYAIGLVAEADRREIALLRARGAGPAHLRRQLTVETLVVGAIGAIGGLLVAAAVLTVLFGTPFPPGATAAALATSAAIAIVSGLLTTGFALYLPRRMALAHDVTEERRDIVSSAPAMWLRLRLDVVLIAFAAAIEGITLLAGGFRPTAAEGQSLSLSFYTLLAPVLLWVGLTLLLVRVVLAFLRRADRGPRSPFGSIVGGLARRGLARRSGPFAAGLTALALAVAFGTSLALFIATYDAHQRSDARVVVGGDLRVTPSTAVPHAATDSSWLMAPGVSEATAVVQINDALVGNDKRALVAVDPAAFGRVAAPPDAFFVNQTTSGTLAALQADPNAVLVSDELARTFNILPGDAVMLRLPRIDGTLVPAMFHAVGEFKNFPGFPQGIDLVATRTTVASLTGRTAADFFVLRTDANSNSAIASVAATLRARPDANSLQVQTVAEAYSQDQSTLAALNLSGLSQIVTVFTVLMSAAAAAIFIAATLAARGKEFIILRALGLDPSRLRRLIAVEGALLVAIALVIGVAVGAAAATLDIQILAPLFVVPPFVPDPAIGGVAALAVLVLAASALAIVAGSARVARLRPAEILREE
ncbi:MAG TPA: FtsX-like permease family protein [Candidatus Limnocylindria bacterium]|nr:FtsX-like permease family protein [Candidatus Limnocylindria bacterium]